VTIRYSGRALRQLDEILAYIAAENERAAEKISLRFETLGALIARHPTMGRPTDLNSVRVFRAAPYPYLLFYHTNPASGDVTVLRIRHTSRKENWKEGH
jgi:addiction module RelE/StbE family toxin